MLKTVIKFKVQPSTAETHKLYLRDVV